MGPDDASLISSFLAWCGVGAVAADHRALMIGMFLGGLVMAMVPISISVGIGMWVLKQRRLTGEGGPGDETRGA